MVSKGELKDKMHLYGVIISVMMLFLVIGAVDLCMHNKFGFGAEFYRAFPTAGKMLLLMAGYICLAPALAGFLLPVLSPLFAAIGSDPSLFAGLLFASDEGGAMLAAHLANSKEAGVFAGYIVASVIGATITFTIPAPLASVPREGRARRCVVCGLLAGIVTAPFGMLAGGLTAGLSFGMMLHNLIPVVIFVTLLFLGLCFFADAIIKVFMVIGDVTLDIAYLSLGAAAIEKLCGIIVIPGMAPIDEAFKIVGGIALILAGAFPLLHFINMCLSKSIEKISARMGISTIAFSGLLASLANSIAAFEMMKNMDDRGITMNAAFAVAAAWTFGDHLGFTALTRPELLVPVITAKLTAGILALIAASFIYDRLLNEKIPSE